MADQRQFKLNGTLIKKPSTFKIEKYKLTNNPNRLASGLMVADVIARKRKFYFTYNAISSTDLDTILNIIWENNNYFFTLSYVENGITKTATVYPGSIPAELHRSEGVWVWKNVSFDLIEQ